MFFYHTYKNHTKKAHIIQVFQSSYDIKKNYKILKYNAALLFPKYRVLVEFGEYNKDSKKTIELEKAGLKIFNVPNGECIFLTCSRLLYVLKNIEDIMKSK